MLLSGALVELYAAPGAGKTFTALDWVLSIAAGVPWLGHATLQAQVFYIYTEGQTGLRQRMNAWFAEHGKHLRPVIAKNFLAMHEPLNMRNPREVKKFIHDLREEGFRPAVIVIDTLNKCFGSGDESRTQDMTEFVGGSKRFGKRFPTRRCWSYTIQGRTRSAATAGQRALRGSQDAALPRAARQNRQAHARNDQV